MTSSILLPMTMVTQLLEVRMKQFLLVLSLVSVCSSASVFSIDGNMTTEVEACPETCSCSRDIVNCSGANLDKVPILADTAIKTMILDDNYISYLDSDSFGPSNQSNLEVLTIRHNNISAIDPATFQRLSGLRYLYLDWNRISSLPSTIFEATSDLQSLSLVYNPLGATELDWIFLRTLISLKELDVSETSIGSLHRLPLAFSGLSALEELTMQKLYLNMTNGYFEVLGDTDFRTLDLSISVIKNVEEDAFLPLVHLRNLNLANAMIDSKSCENIFHGLANSSLEKINMQGIFIYSEFPVEADLFRHLINTKVRELNFAGNYVGLRGRIPSKLFHPLKSLRKLHLDDCDLVSIRQDTFHGLHEIKVLTLRRNLLSCVRGSECGFLSPEHPMRHLEILDLSDNRITEVENTIHFKGVSFPGLESLDLRRNRLSSIPAGMFGAMKKLTRLDLSENQIEDIESEAFSQLESLTHLDLDNCPQLTRIRQDAFKGLVKLKSLSICNGRLIHINHAALLHLNHLEELYLRNNRLGQGNNGIAKVVIRKSSLMSLDLGENGLTTFPRGLLSNSFHLHRLHLDGNRLSECRSLAELPEVLSQLETLDLSYNSLVDPSKACFESLKNLRTIDLSVNPFYCSCGTRQFSSWLQRSGISVAMETDHICAAPEALVKSSIFQLTLSSFDCYWKYGIVCGLLACLLVAAAVIILTLCFRQRTRHSSGAICNGSSAGDRASTVEALSPGCAMFGKSAPYTQLDEEECTAKESVDEQELATSGVYRLERNFHPVSSQGGATLSVVNDPRQSMNSKKPSKCNGFSRAKTRQQAATTKADAAMQTRALVQHASTHLGEDDLARETPFFLAHSSDVDHIESLEDTV